MKNENPNVLVVDDNPENLNLIRSFLKDKRYNIRVSMNGEQALSTLRDSIPDIILLDINLPGLDGFEVCRRIKNEEELKDIPVIFISALTDSFNKLQGFEAGAIDYMIKPIEVDELQVKLNIHLHVGNVIKENKKLKSELEQKENEIKELKNKTKF